MQIQAQKDHTNRNTLAPAARLHSDQKLAFNAPQRARQTDTRTHTHTYQLAWLHTCTPKGKGNACSIGATLPNFPLAQSSAQQQRVGADFQKTNKKQEAKVEQEESENETKRKWNLVNRKWRRKSLTSGPVRVFGRGSGMAFLIWAALGVSFSEH